MGLSFILFGLLYGWMVGVFTRVQNKRKTSGIIYRCEYKRYAGEDRDKYPHIAHVEYMVAGRRYTIKSQYRSSAFREGKRVIVFYNECDPEEASIRPHVMRYIFMAGLIILGITLSAIDFME